jgi:hypothetical protein
LARPPELQELLRFASGVSMDPAGAVRTWQLASGGKVVGCVSPFAVPEILHAAGLLPVELCAGAVPDALSDLLDAFVTPGGGPDVPEAGAGRKPRFEAPRSWALGIEETLDLLEAIAEWAERLSGEAFHEGALHRSLARYGECRDGIARVIARCSGPNPLLSPEELRDVCSARKYLAAETYARLLFRILGESSPAPVAERGDPLLELARRGANGLSACDR